MRFSPGSADWRMQLAVAYASMAVIPLLSFGYFLAAGVLSYTVTMESLILIAVCNIVILLAGFSVCRIARRTEALTNDVECRKKTEQALRESNMMLSDALSDLKEMEHRLLQEERMSALGQMASSVAHDFNNALMPVVGLTEFLLMNRDKLDDKAELISTLEDIHTSADHARQAVVRLREFYKSDDEVDFGVVDVNAVFEKAVVSCGLNMQKDKQGDKAINICRKCEDVPFVNADESALRSAMRNIIINAMEAMPGGGSITFSSRQEGKWVVMEIIDTGIGMTPDVQAHCLDPFFSTKGVHGAGIGLSVVYGIVRRHRGSIDVRSETGKGTSVKILLPSIQVMPPATSVTPGKTGDIGNMSVLIIDDDVSSRKILSRYLTTQGCTVKTAESGSKGLEIFANEKVDLVITDRAMPDMSGDLVAASIMKKNSMIPVIMLTGFGAIMKDRREIPEGVKVVLGKPVSLKELKEVMSGLVGSN